MEKPADAKPLLPRPMLEYPWTPLKLALAGTLLASGCHLFEWLNPVPLGGAVATTYPAPESQPDQPPLAEEPLQPTPTRLWAVRLP